MLTPSRRRKPIVCELQPLNSGEIAAFIKTSKRPADIFDERAIKRIALYANGYPGTVNSICERALQLAGDSTDAKIPELIESAASDLNLRRFDNSSDSEIFSLPSDTLGFEPKPSEKFENNDQDIPYRFSADKEVSSAPIFPPHTAEVDGVNWRPRKRPTTAWVRGLVILVILVGAAAVLRTDTALNVVSNGIATLNQVAAPYLRSAAQPKIPGEIPRKE